LKYGTDSCDIKPLSENIRQIGFNLPDSGTLPVHIYVGSFTYPEFLVLYWLKVQRISAGGMHMIVLKYFSGRHRVSTMEQQGVKE
tara:strand:- start:440716 stop:440970 length:255 start_codon:yes stop_codon:yes gene_type:complete